MTEILIFGKNGQLGWELRRALSTIGALVACNRQDANFEDVDAVRRAVTRHRPRFIVNAAAYTAVDQAESDPEKTLLVNHTAVQVLAEEALRLDAWLIHFSSDYVFDGTKSSPYVETDATSPLNVYGRSKAASEKAICSLGGKHLILRSSWLYSAHRLNFPLTILRSAEVNDELAVVADSIGAPTSTPMLADITATIMRKIVDAGHTDAFSGLYHVTAAGEASWWEFARFILRQAEKNGVRLRTDANRVIRTSRAAYGGAAARPESSRLDTSLFREKFGVYLPHWSVGAEHFVEELVRSRFARN